MAGRWFDEELSTARPYADTAAATLVIAVFWLPPTLTAGDWPRTAAGCVLAGITGWAMIARHRRPGLAAGFAPPEVLQAVRTVHAGHAMLAPEVTARLLRRIAPPRPDRRHAFVGHVLSAREVQVARLVARGYSNQRIADELVLSPETVRTYLRRMFAKLDVSDRTQLAVLAHEAGLLHDRR